VKSIDIIKCIRNKLKIIYKHCGFMKVNVTIPVYNEEKVLEKSIFTLTKFLEKNFSEYTWEILIADNASIDKTLEVAKMLKNKYEKVNYIHLDQKGRGRALKKAWSESDADIVSFMDADLSTRLEHFPEMINGMVKGGYSIAIGSRLIKNSRTKRSFRREFISRFYNLLVRSLFYTKFSDAQCGFKAVTREVVNKIIIPYVEDTGWFFDSELLIIGEKLGYKILDIPVEWIEDTDSRVKIIKTATDDIKGLLRVKSNFMKGVYKNGR
jgi:glycosyltransferase involved in cell wall biosynthesis